MAAFSSPRNALYHMRNNQPIHLNLFKKKIIAVVNINLCAFRIQWESKIQLAASPKASCR